MSISVSKDTRRDELQQLDENRKKLRTKSHEADNAAWKVFIPLLVDEMVDKIHEFGRSVPLEDSAAEYYFGDDHLILKMERGTLFNQLDSRIPPSGKYNLEPFPSFFNEEMAKRGASIRFKTDSGWNGRELYRV